METPILTSSELVKYLELTGKRGAQTISILGKLHKHFNSVMNNEIGKELLSSAINRIDELIFKIYEETINEQELAEFRFLKKVYLPRTIDKVMVYLKKLEEVKTVVNLNR